MQGLPNPNNFTTWQEWASEMQKAVESNLVELEAKKACVELVVPDVDKPRGGFPAAKPGDLVVDTTSDELMYFARSKEWKSL